MTLTRYVEFPLTAVLQLDEARREGLKVSTRRYAVQEQAMTEQGRVFKFEKPLPHEVDYEPYVVLLKPEHTGFPVCNCVANLKSGWCCHTDCLIELRKAGAMPEPVKETVS